jgi:hypothetical protein
MAFPSLSLVVKGADHHNRAPRRKPGISRRFEIALCRPGEPVSLHLEPDNPVDPSAIAIYSARAIQIGYVSADRTGLIGSRMRAGIEVRAIFQQATRSGAIIRIAFDGEEPSLPASESAKAPPQTAIDDNGFWPDETWPDD